MDTRRIRLCTGIGGMDLFQESIENIAGYYRVYIGKKVSRITRLVPNKIKKSLSGRYYKVTRTPNI